MVRTDLLHHARNLAGVGLPRIYLSLKEKFISKSDFCQRYKHDESIPVPESHYAEEAKWLDLPAALDRDSSILKLMGGNKHCPTEGLMCA